jgi:hypothetical protein
MAGERRLVDDPYDREAGVQTWHTYDPHTQETTIEVVQDAAPFLEINRAERNLEAGGAMGLTGKDRKEIQRGWWHYARIPIGVQYVWLRDYGVDVYREEHQKKVLKLLNSPDWKYLKTTDGTHT